MTIMEVKDFLYNLTGHITFDYLGYSCGIDPIALDHFDMWYGNKEATAISVVEVLKTPFFDGKSLTDIWSDTTNIDF